MILSKILAPYGSVKFLKLATKMDDPKARK